MSHQPTSRTHRLAPTARRAWWMLLILIHVPVLVSVGRSMLAHPEEGKWLPFVALCLTVLVFVLKLLDAPFLRFRTRRGAALAFLLVCAVVHHEVAASEVGRELLKQTPVILVAGIVVHGFRRSLGRWQPRWREVWRHLIGVFGCAVVVAPPWTVIRLAELRVTPRTVDSRVCIPRAPPV
ncbi:MAG: hypothetical protein IIA64_07350 [Planctomycetes bacterium]|nr:hypothetical protein [Planctomycetota bacterium]